MSAGRGAPDEHWFVRAMSWSALVWGPFTIPANLGDAWTNAERWRARRIRRAHRVMRPGRRAGTPRPLSTFLTEVEL